MAAEPLGSYDPDDPIEILRLLPDRFHEQFKGEYEAAAAQARHVEGFRLLREMLRLWRLRAIAYSDPGFDGRLEAVRAAVLTGRQAGLSAAEVFPDWPGRSH